MIDDWVTSDQLYDWSVKKTITVLIGPSAKTCSTASTATVDEGSFARFANRALQTMWSTWVQMRTGTRSRAQILSLRQSAWGSTSHGVHSSLLSRRSARAVEQLQKGKADHGRDHGDQPRAVTQKRAAELDSDAASCKHRCRRCRHACSKHDSSVARIRACSRICRENSGTAVYAIPQRPSRLRCTKGPKGGQQS